MFKQVFKLKIKKSIKIKFFYLFTLMTFAFSQSASAIDIPSVGEVLDEVEQRYGFDENSLRNAKKKVDYPSVELFFDDTDPENGDVVTATAITGNFLTGNESLYFTWMLLHKEDLDDVDEEAIEAAKREAMGILARGDFDPALFAVDYSDENSDSDNDGFNAAVGGGDGVGAKDEGDCLKSSSCEFEDQCYDDSARETVDSDCITRCYMHNFGLRFDSENNDKYAGRDKVVKCKHVFPDADQGEQLSIKYEDGSRKTFNCQDDYEIGDGSFTNNEEACWKTDPLNSDTDGDGIEDEADLAGLGQESFTWEYRDGDMIGVFVEGTSQVAINEASSNPAYLSSYYKITWAGLRSCSSDEDDEDFADDDGCDEEDDYGYYFNAFQSVSEKASENLETELSFGPANPQIDASDETYSDTIIIDSSISNEVEDDNFVYYKWEIYKCAGGDIQNCSVNEDSIHLTYNCEEGDLLSDCVKLCEDENGDLGECTGAVGEEEVEVIESDSHAEGMGIDDIKFKPKESLIKGDKEYLKVFLKTKRYKADARYSLSSAVIPVSKNNLKLKLFKVSQQKDGTYGFNENEDEICREGLYKLLCPVYPNQVVAAKVIDDEYSDATFYWERDGEVIQSPLVCETLKGGCASRNIMYFPITNEEQIISDITVKAEVEGAVNLTSQRMLSVNNPRAILNTEDNQAAWPTLLADGSTVDSYFNTEPGNQVEFKAELVPDYLEIGTDVALEWLINGSEVTEDLVEKNPELRIGFEDKRITYKILGKVGSADVLGAKITKTFSLDDQLLLQKNWSLKEFDSLENTNEVVFRKIYDSANDGVGSESASLKFFLASTLKNSPEYLIHILRLSIILIMIWGIIFGVDYFVKDSVIRKIKK